MKIITFKVAGVSHENRQSILASLRGDEPCRIEAEPTNPYDPNALAVKVATKEGVKHVGYVPRDLAKTIAPAFQGEYIMAKLDRIVGGFETAWGDTALWGLVVTVEVPVE